MAKRKPFQGRRSFPLEWWTKTFGAASTEHPAIEGTVERLTGRSARAEQRIATFILKNQINGEQDWGAKWICFGSIAQYCASLGLPRKKSTAGEAGKKFAYNKLIKDVELGHFTVSGRCRVLLLVSHGGNVFTIKPSELSEAREVFDPDTFIAGYLNRCWTRAGLVSQWFLRNDIPSPWQSMIKRILRMGRGRLAGAPDHARDVDVIDRALEIRAVSKREIRKAVAHAISEIESKINRSGEETDRLRTKMRKRHRLRQKNKET